MIGIFKDIVETFKSLLDLKDRYKNAKMADRLRIAQRSVLILVLIVLVMTTLIAKIFYFSSSSEVPGAESSSDTTNPDSREEKKKALAFLVDATGAFHHSLGRVKSEMGIILQLEGIVEYDLDSALEEWASKLELYTGDFEKDLSRSDEEYGAFSSSLTMKEFRRILREVEAGVLVPIRKMSEADPIVSNERARSLEELKKIKGLLSSNLQNLRGEELRLRSHDI